MTNRLIPGIMTRDVAFSGDGRIYGTVRIGANPASRRVRLIDRITGALAREQFSDAAGGYDFRNIERDRKFCALAHDHTDTYNAVVADILAAEQMAPATPSGSIVDPFDASGGYGTDPDFDKVIFLCHCDHIEVFNQKTQDWSPRKTDIRVYGPVESSDWSKSGGKSFFVNVIYRSIFNNVTHADFDFSAVDFTAEGWYRSTILINGGQHVMESWGGNVGWIVYAEQTTGALKFYHKRSGLPADTYNVGVSLALNTDYHIAVTKDSGGTSVWVNGTEYVIGALSYSTQGSTTYFTVGGNSSLGWQWRGYFDEIRVTRGLARYTTAFTPLNAFPHIKG